jgi:predicted metal-dependent phosphotriesterase family hydrolase
MSFVRTILGDVAIDRLRCCGAHEHTIIDALTSRRNTLTFFWMTSTRHVRICENFAMLAVDG